MVHKLKGCIIHSDVALRWRVPGLSQCKRNIVLRRLQVESDPRMLPFKFILAKLSQKQDEELVYVDLDSGYENAVWNIIGVEQSFSEPDFNGHKTQCSLHVHYSVPAAKIEQHHKGISQHWPKRILQFIHSSIRSFIHAFTHLSNVY